MSYDFIFCPLCGGSKWLTDKTKSVTEGRLTVNKCGACKKFVYTNVTVLVKHEILVGVTQTVRYSVEAQIDPYIVFVQYRDNYTQFQNSDDRGIILRLNQTVTFNWYKNEELANKIKKYLVFS